ncbi:MAG: hypothetical protein K0S27_1138 [Gammaproteobacteria bacterium]|nr:hypothetical protein [Gammaproteobacteria bacterium]
MFPSKDSSINLLKEKIRNKPTQYMDSLFSLLPENTDQAKKILQFIDELVKEKKLSRHLLYKKMEEPIYFQDTSCQDFSRREPLIAKLIRHGGLIFLNHYLNYKYGSPLSAELLKLHDIFNFTLPPIKKYIDKSNEYRLANKEEKARIAKKYLATYGMSHDLFGDILQEKNMSILKQLANFNFDFNQPIIMDRLKKYLYIHRSHPLQIPDETLQFLLDHHLNPDNYLDLFLTALWDELSLFHTLKNDSLIHLINFLLDHNATFSRFSLEMLEKLYHHICLETEKITSLTSHPQKQTLKEMWYLQGQLKEITTSLEAAKPYYFKAGIRGMHTVQRKELINLFKMVQSLSKDNLKSGSY